MLIHAKGTVRWNWLVRLDLLRVWQLLRLLQPVLLAMPARCGQLQLQRPRQLEAGLYSASRNEHD